MTDLPPAIIGLLRAAAIVALVAAIMLGLDSWNWEVLATSVLVSAPVFVAARDAAPRRPPPALWVPPWERTSVKRRER